MNMHVDFVNNSSIKIASSIKTNEEQTILVHVSRCT